tara:strand:+ start:193 stop:375 length:183 start_codon:yes stop_codon:yes gene_type:complete
MTGGSFLYQRYAEAETPTVAQTTEASVLQHITIPIFWPNGINLTSNYAAIKPKDAFALDI